MGKNDPRTRKGKINKGSYGKVRPRSGKSQTAELKKKNKKK
jgi:ribosomal small subunit protein bTHX